MNPRERFKENTDAFIRMIKDYPDEHFNTKPDEESWSAAEIAEHIYRSEFGISKLFSGEKKVSEKLLSDQRVEKMEKIMLDTSRKAQAFGAIIPRGDLKTKEELTGKFRENREKILSAYDESDQDDLCMNFEHPMFGYLTVREWLEFNVFHTLRHMKQMTATLKNISK
ncbi:DinB family protein [Balneola sp. MJW-20]|uniref:DinB family protein n=1 Tax=Gracilimonas aurantiaca TaxID=3234185 RepID=UPI003465180D